LKPVDGVEGNDEATGRISMPPELGSKDPADGEPVVVYGVYGRTGQHPGPDIKVVDSNDEMSEPGRLPWVPLYVSNYTIFDEPWYGRGIVGIHGFLSRVVLPVWVPDTPLLYMGPETMGVGWDEPLGADGGYFGVEEPDTPVSPSADGFAVGDDEPVWLVDVVVDEFVPDEPDGVFAGRAYVPYDDVSDIPYGFVNVLVPDEPSVWNSAYLMTGPDEPDMTDGEVVSVGPDEPGMKSNAVEFVGSDEPEATRVGVVPVGADEPDSIGSPVRPVERTEVSPRARFMDVPKRDEPKVGFGFRYTPGADEPDLVRGSVVELGDDEAGEVHGVSFDVPPLIPSVRPEEKAVEPAGVVGNGPRSIGVPTPDIPPVSI
jgi:hypothetical protein